MHDPGNPRQIANLSLDSPEAAEGQIQRNYQLERPKTEPVDRLSTQFNTTYGTGILRGGPTSYRCY